MFEWVRVVDLHVFEPELLCSWVSCGDVRRDNRGSTFDLFAFLILDCLRRICKSDGHMIEWKPKTKRSGMSGMLIYMYSTYRQEYIRTRVGNSRSFCYECCHGRIRSSSSLPTSVCTKNGKTFILERWTQRWTLYFDEHVHAKCRPSLKCQSKRWSFWRERACTCSALSA